MEWWNNVEELFVDFFKYFSKTLRECEREKEVWVGARKEILAPFIKTVFVSAKFDLYFYIDYFMNSFISIL